MTQFKAPVDPPLGTAEVVGGSAANTYSTYDAMGRQMFLSGSSGIRVGDLGG